MGYKGVLCRDSTKELAHPNGPGGGAVGTVNRTRLVFLLNVGASASLLPDPAAHEEVGCLASGSAATLSQKVDGVHFNWPFARACHWPS